MYFLWTHFYLPQAVNEFWLEQKTIFEKFKKKKVDCIYLFYFVFVPKGFYIFLQNLGWHYFQYMRNTAISFGPPNSDEKSIVIQIITRLVWYGFCSSVYWTKVWLNMGLMNYIPTLISLKHIFLIICICAFLPKVCRWRAGYRRGCWITGAGVTDSVNNQMWVLETELRSSAKAAGVPNHWVNSPSLLFQFYFWFWDRITSSCSRYPELELTWNAGKCCTCDLPAVTFQVVRNRGLCHQLR